MKVSLLKARIIVRWLLFTVVIAYVITGLGILYYQTVTAITFGLLTKSLSFVIHNYLLIPFLILLVLHIFLAIRVRGRIG